jgi:3D (Asp-Asp-Asp) domain-containing protein
MRITAYSSSQDETDYDPFYTANGIHVHDGVVASNLFPFGTKIEIPALFGDKVFTVDDRMAKRFQKTIDIWMTSKEKALVFGVAHAQVIVLGTTTLESYNPPVSDKEIAGNIK